VVFIVYSKRGIIDSGFLVSMLSEGLLKVVACDGGFVPWRGVKLFMLEIYSRGSEAY